MHLHAYEPWLCLDVPSQACSGCGKENCSVEGLEQVLNSVKFAVTRTISQLRDGRAALYNPPSAEKRVYAEQTGIQR